MGFDDVKKKNYLTERQLNKSGKALQETLETTMKNNSWMTFLESFFGAIEIDIEIPEDKYDTFAEMPPIFKNCVCNEEDSSTYIKNTILCSNKNFQRGENFLLH